MTVIEGPVVVESGSPLTSEQAAMVEANRGLIGFVLRRRSTRARDWDDAFQDGVFGLIRAAQLFDPSRGVKFSTYAVTWIRQSVGRGREDAGGSGFRRAVRNGLEWDSPLSLDLPVGDLADMAVGELVASPVDVEGEAGARVMLAEVEAVARRMCRDRVDGLVVDRMFEFSDRSALQDDLELATELGCGREAVRRRRTRIRDGLRLEFGVALDELPDRLHGTRSCYLAGCRLEECRAANRAYSVALRERSA